MAETQNRVAVTATDPLPPFATPEQLEAFTKGKVPAGDPTGDATLAAVSATFRRYCGWHIYPALDLDLLLDSEGGFEVHLPSKQVNGVTELSDQRTTTVIDAETYEWSRLGQVRMTSYKTPNCSPSSWAYWQAGWPYGYRVLHALFNSGYEDAPADLVMLTLTVASRALSSPSGATREQAGQVSISYATAAPGVAGGVSLLAPERELLDVYRIVGA